MSKLIIPDGISLKKEQPKIVTSSHELPKASPPPPAPGSPAEILEQFMSDEAKMLVASAIGMNQQAMSGQIPKEALPELRKMSEVLINAATLVDTELMSSEVEPFISEPKGEFTVSIPDTDEPDDLFEIALKLRATARLVENKVAQLANQDEE
jgi:hypothetical protein